MKKNNYKKYLYLFLLLLLITNSVLAQQKMITGTINDESGIVVANATITIREQPGIQVFTDIDGKFSILGEIGQLLEVSTRDHRFKSVRTTADQMNLVMSSEDELIPIGNRMELRKEEVTSAIGYVKSDELLKSSVRNPANALYGKIPGLTVLENGGTNWSNDPRMYIRGVETFGIGSFVNTNILTMVDGFERPISSLSVAEIENVAILKDAASLAMYGLRGANGVLLVTTKKGTGKGLSVDVNYEHGITHAFRLPNFLDSYNYASAVNQARSNDGLLPLYSQPELDRYKSGVDPYLYPNVDWLRQGLRDYGSTDKLNISFQEQASAIRYFAVINYDNEMGLFGPVDENKGYSTQSTGHRFNFRSNIDIDITNNTKLTINLAGNLGENSRPSTTNSEADIFSTMFNTPSAAYPVKSSDNIWGGTSIYNNNPVATISTVGYTVQGKRELMTDMILNHDFNKYVKGLTAEGGISFDKSFDYLDIRTKQFQYEQLTPVLTPTGDVIDQIKTIYGTNTTMSFSTSVPTQWMRTTIFGDLKYSKEWEDSKFNSVLLVQREELIRSGQNNTYRHELLAGNAHYSKSEKYFADLTLAYNGTNILPENNRFGFFPAVSVAWKLSNEEFLKENRVVNNLKLRASWGITGNDQIIQNIDKSPFVGSSTYYFMSNNTSFSSYREGRLLSSPLTFESSYKSNFGLDAGLFKVLDLNVDIFYDKRNSILVQTSNSLIVGVPTPYGSVGKTTSKGIELGLNLHQSINDLNYHIGGQVSFAKNKIIEMQEVYRPEEYLKRTGQSINQAFGLEAIGFFADNADIAASPKQTFSIIRPGDIKYKDQNNDGIINSYDEVPIGHSTQLPELYFSASAGLEFKGVGIDLLLQGTANQTIYLNTSSIFWPLVTNTNISTYSNDAWTPATAPTATLPRLTMSDNANNYRPNSIWYADGSYIKLRSAELYYNFPKQMVSKLKLAKAQLYVRGMNLLSFDHIKVVDPEAIGLTYPTVSSCNMGIRLSF